MTAPEPESGAVPAERDAEVGVAAAAPVPHAPDLGAAAEERLSLATRLSDRLNPILVRETQQAVNGKTFLAALVLALVSIVLVALSTAGTGRSTRADGWAAFVLGMQVLTPILCLVVPLQAFLSTRHEVSGGTIEHLMLSRLTPAAVVRGKIAASVVESLVFLSVFAPLIALTYLLRGVDVPTIAVALGLAFVYSVGATVFAVAMGAICRWPGLRALPLVVVALGLTIGTGMLTLGMRGALREITFVLRRTEIGGRGVVTLAMPVLLSAPFLFLIASAALAHPYENRSTAFRVFALVGVVGMASWLAWTYSAPLIGAGTAAQYVPRFLAAAAILSTPFWMFAATEEENLSPRVRTLVPKRPLLAAGAVPFLPGGGRGLLFTILLAACAVASAVYLPLLFAGVPGRSDDVVLAVKAWCYVLLYACLAKFLRNLMPAGPRATALLRAGFPAVVAFLALLPAVLKLLAGATSSDVMPLAGLNPFATLDPGSPKQGTWVVLAAPLALLLHTPAMLRGAREVVVASRARRDRAA